MHNIKFIFLSIFILSFFIILSTDTVLAEKSSDEDNKEKFDLECSKQIAVTAVKTAAEGLGGILNGIKDENERINIIQKFIDPIRFYSDKSGYFFVYNSNGVNIAHAFQKELVGKDLSHYKDGKAVLTEKKFLAAAKSGGGFIEFFWVKPGSTGEKKKIGYAEMIPGTEYYIGTGVYLPDN